MKIVTNREEIKDGLYSYVRTEYSDKSHNWTFKNGSRPTYWSGSSYVDFSNKLEEEYQRIKNANYNGEHPEVDNPVGQVDLTKLYYDIINKGVITEHDKVLHISAQTLADTIVNKPVETDKEQPKDGIWYKGKHLELSYVELYDLLHVYVLNSVGSLHRKCMNAFNTVIPTSKG